MTHELLLLDTPFASKFFDQFFDKTTTHHNQPNSNMADLFQPIEFNQFVCYQVRYTELIKISDSKTSIRVGKYWLEFDKTRQTLWIKTTPDAYRYRSASVQLDPLPGDQDFPCWKMWTLSQKEQGFEIVLFNDVLD